MADLAALGATHIIFHTHDLSDNLKAAIAQNTKALFPTIMGDDYVVSPESFESMEPEHLSIPE